MSDEMKILRYEVPVDDRWHEVAFSGEIVHVASRRPDVVEFWALGVVGDDDQHWLRVYGTGQPITDGIAAHHGTAFAAGGALVWHLLEAYFVDGGIVRTPAKVV